MTPETQAEGREEPRYAWASDIDSIVDMHDLWEEDGVLLGREVTSDDVLERLNDTEARIRDLEARNAVLEAVIEDAVVRLNEWAPYSESESLRHALLTPDADAMYKTINDAIFPDDGQVEIVAIACDDCGVAMEREPRKGD